jgi:ORF6N domain
MQLRMMSRSQQQKQYDDSIVIGERRRSGIVAFGPTNAAVSLTLKRKQTVLRKLHSMKANPPDPLSSRIYTIRGQRVILDADLARLYGTTPRSSTKPSSATQRVFRKTSLSS